MVLVHTRVSGRIPIAAQLADFFFNMRSAVRVFLVFLEVPYTNCCS